MSIYKTLADALMKKETKFKVGSNGPRPPEEDEMMLGWE